MIELQQAIAQNISEALQNLYTITVEPTAIALQPTRKEFAGTFTFVTFSYTKTIGKTPDIIGVELGKHLKEKFNLQIEFLHYPTGL